MQLAREEVPGVELNVKRPCLGEKKKERTHSVSKCRHNSTNNTTNQLHLRSRATRGDFYLDLSRFCVSILFEIIANCTCRERKIALTLRGEARRACACVIRASRIAIELQSKQRELRVGNEEKRANRGRKKPLLGRE